jgi:hypothetical protein
MHLKVSARFTLADRPKEYHGFTSTDYRFGADGPLPFSQMCRQVIDEIAEWYCELEEPATLNYEVKQLHRWVEGLVFNDHADSDGSEVTADAD